MNDELRELIEIMSGDDRAFLVGVLKRNDKQEIEGAVYTANEIIGGRNAQ